MGCVHPTRAGGGGIPDTRVRIPELRPIWHEEEKRIQAHILVCFLAYVLWRTLGQMCSAARLGTERRKVAMEHATIGMVDIVLPTRQGVDIRIRRDAQPDKHQAILLQRLKMELPKTLDIPEIARNVVEKIRPERPILSVYTRLQTHNCGTWARCIVLFLVIAEFILLPPPPEAKRSGADDSQSGFRAFAPIVVSPGARGILLEIGHR